MREGMDMTDSLGRRQFLAGAAMMAAGAVTGSRPGMAAGLQVNIVNTDGAASACLQEMIRRAGYLDQLGVEAKFTNIVGTPKLVDALVKGDADACIYSGFSPVLTAIEQGAPLKIVAGANLLPVQAVFAKSPAITRLKDLEGKTVGVGAAGALLHQVMYAALEKVGADPSKVKFVDIGSSAQVWRAILADKVDAGPSEASYLDVQDKNGVHVLSDGKFWDTVPTYTNQASYMSDAAIRDKREALVKTLAAHARLYRLLHDPKSWDAYAEARKAALKNDSPEEARGQWDFYQARKPFAVDLVLSEERIRYVQQLNVEMGLQKKILPFDQVADMSLARDALKLIG
jgi:ABC-type nitrate/sulfonate/bicarbonate transport system substrate-binding protein